MDYCPDHRAAAREERRSALKERRTEEKCHVIKPEFS
jgi:hypothetical protein